MPVTQMQIKELLDELLSRFGDFHIFTFYNNRDREEHAAMGRGDIINAENVPVRVHSECLTDDSFGSVRCDCCDQLEAALKQIGMHPTDR
jgi:GTP cyclohydrolase II